MILNRDILVHNMSDNNDSHNTSTNNSRGNDLNRGVRTQGSRAKDWPGESQTAMAWPEKPELQS